MECRLNIILEPTITESEFGESSKLVRCANCGSSLLRAVVEKSPYNMSIRGKPEENCDEITIEKNLLEMEIYCAKCGDRVCGVTYYVEKKAVVKDTELNFEEV